MKRNMMYEHSLRRSIRKEAAQGSLDGKEVTYAEGGGLITAALTLVSFTLRIGGRLASQMQALVAAWCAVIDARVELVRYQARHTVTTTRNAYHDGYDASLKEGGAWRLVRGLALPVAILFDVVVLVFDFAFFVGLYRDLGDVVIDDWTSPDAMMATFGALATPLLVFGAALGLGHYLAARLAWPDRATSRLAAIVAGACGLLVVVLSGAFVAGAGFRFSQETAAAGATEAPVMLLAIIFGLLPLAAALFHTLVTAPIRHEYRRIEKAYHADRKQIERLQDRVGKAMTRLANAHRALSDSVVTIISRADEQAGLAHRIIAEERARSGKSGTYARFSAATGTAAEGEDPLARPLLMLDLPFPARIARLLEQAMTVLTAHDPANTEAMDAEVADRLRVLAIVPAPEPSADADGTSTDEAAEPGGLHAIPPGADTAAENPAA